MPLEVNQSVFRSSETMLMYPAAALSDRSLPSAKPRHELMMARSAQNPLETLAGEISRSFAFPCDVRRMLRMSASLRVQFRQKLQSSTTCMLPSFCHTLPSGQETGTYLALDVGGSTFRVALVELRGRFHKDGASKLKRMSVSKIDDKVRRLPSNAFFDWMAGKIQDMLDHEHLNSLLINGPIPIGVAWSFPIEQTSHRSGKVQGMGKGFSCHEGSIGKDLGELIESACTERGILVRVEAIINDSSATLLSQAYVDPATSMGLIVGTGTNAAAYLPTACIGKDKFGQRDPSWFARAEKVITNTELSMFGKGILPETRWDDILNRNHQLPDFQPLEYMTTGRYLGEIFRLIIVDAVNTCHLFGGVLPDVLRESYSLDTAILAAIEGDETAELLHATSAVKTAFGLETVPDAHEVVFLRAACEAISHRAAVYLAVAIHALWTLQKETEINPTTPCGTPKTAIACNGSVILKYPGFRSRCEAYIGQMISHGSSAGGIFTTEQVALEPTDEAAVLGAAVAVATSGAT